MISMVGRRISFSFMVLERQFIEVHWGRRRWTLYHSERFFLWMDCEVRFKLISFWNESIKNCFGGYVDMWTCSVLKSHHVNIYTFHWIQCVRRRQVRICWFYGHWRQCGQSNSRTDTKLRNNSDANKKNRKKWIIIKLCVISTQPAIHHLLSFKNEIFHRTPT